MYRLRSAKLLYDQFIDGYDSETDPISVEDQIVLNKTFEKLEEVFGWNLSVSFIRLSSQKCSDMLIYTGELIHFRSEFS